MRFVHPILFGLILLLSPAAMAEQLIETRDAANRYDSDIHSRFGWAEDAEIGRAHV